MCASIKNDDIIVSQRTIDGYEVGRRSEVKKCSIEEKFVSNIELENQQDGIHSIGT